MGSEVGVMGDAADDVLDGLCCEGCGEWFEDVLNGAEAPGFVRRCEACKPKTSKRKREGVK
jgi:hypothetical protein